MSTKAAKYAFEQLMDLASIKLIAMTKDRPPMAGVLSVEEYQRLKALGTPETSPASEEQG